VPACDVFITETRLFPHPHRLRRPYEFKRLFATLTGQKLEIAYTPRQESGGDE
jgi:hypothetical protein